MHHNMIQSLQGCSVPGQFELNQQSGNASLVLSSTSCLQCSYVHRHGCRPWDPPQQMHRCQSA